MSDPTNPDSQLTGFRYWITFLFAVVLVVLFVLGCLMLYFAADNADDTLWGRYIWVFGGLEAVVFTAVGWIFGREVNRTAVETATKQLERADAVAENASQEAKTARDENAGLTEKVAHGRALAEAVRSVDAQQIRGRDVSRGDAVAAPAPIGALKELADRLFPPS